MPAERPISKASENRRATKPIMEKRRRARINQCLSELKTLILDALNKDPSRHSKLEKADILEMTVHHLQNIQRQQMAAALSTDSSVLNKFKAGFSECATEVSRYVGRLEGLDPSLRQRLLSHLSNCIASINSNQQQQQQQISSSNIGMLQSLSLQITSGGGDINSNGGLSLIPSRLPNGELAFLLPSQQASGPIRSFAFSSVSMPSSSSSGPDRSSQSSWSPTEEVFRRRLPSPSHQDESMSEEDTGVVLSPTCSDAGSDVFLESTTPKVVASHHQQHHHHAASPHRERHSSPSLHFPLPRRVSETESVWRPW